MKRWLGPLALFGLIGAGYLNGSLDWIESQLTDLRFRVSSRPASGSLVLVEIDARSLHEIDVWPWPRGNHAVVVDHLLDAGAKTVALDIDFSSRSIEREDSALAAALRRAGNRVVLPAFRQVVGSADGQPVFQQTWPQASFAANARVAAVNVVIESDSHVRRYAIAESWNGVVLPSMAAVLAEASAAARAVFTIDFGIRPETVPRLSYIDVLRGDFPADAVRNRNVIVGAAAVELGDNLPVPIYKVLTGPVVQALAYESIVQDRAIARLSPAVTLIIAAALTLFVLRRFARFTWRSGLLSAALASAAALGLPVALQLVFPVSLDAAPAVLSPLLCYAGRLVYEVDRQTFLHFIRRIEGMHRREMMIRVVEDSSDGIIIADFRNRIQICNRSAGELLGRTVESIVGMTVAAVLPVDAETSKPTNEPGRIQIARPDGSSIVADLICASSTPVQLKQRLDRQKTPRTVFIYTFRDVTARQKAEEAQIAAMEQALASDRAKSEFLANMSHELRTPLNAILGFTELMCSEAFGPVGSPRYREYLVDIHGSAKHLLEVISDILDMSKIEAGEMQLLEDEISVANAVSACLAMVADRARTGDVSLVNESSAELPRLFGDERMVKQMVLNLVSNAVKFTPAGGHVRLQSGVGQDGRLFIAVIDSGIGIAPENLELVQKPFRQVDGSLQRKYEGTGLGLPLVKRMVEMHGGTLVLESGVNIGTTATLHFPGDRLIPTQTIEPVERATG